MPLNWAHLPDISVARHLHTCLYTALYMPAIILRIWKKCLCSEKSQTFSLSRKVAWQLRRGNESHGLVHATGVTMSIELTLYYHLICIVSRILQGHIQPVIS
jgi:hypothetical protein